MENERRELSKKLWKNPIDQVICKNVRKALIYINKCVK